MKNNHLRRYALIAASIAALNGCAPQSSRNDRPSYDRLRHGMTGEEVRSAFGRSPDSESSQSVIGIEHSVLTWRDSTSIYETRLVADRLLTKSIVSQRL